MSGCADRSRPWPAGSQTVRPPSRGPNEIPRDLLHGPATGVRHRVDEPVTQEREDGFDPRLSVDREPPGGRACDQHRGRPEREGDQDVDAVADRRRRGGPAPGRRPPPRSPATPRARRATGLAGALRGSTRRSRRPRARPPARRHRRAGSPSPRRARTAPACGSTRGRPRIGSARTPAASRQARSAGCTRCARPGAAARGSGRRRSTRAPGSPPLPRGAAGRRSRPRSRQT